MYRRTEIKNLKKGTVFLYENTEFELIYNTVVIVGLTKEEFNVKGKNGRQAMVLDDDYKVMVKVENLNTVEA